MVKINMKVGFFNEKGEEKLNFLNSWDCFSVVAWCCVDVYKRQVSDPGCAFGTAKGSKRGR